MKVIRIISPVSQDALDQVEDVLDALRINYRVCDEDLGDPTADTIGRWHKNDPDTSRKAAVENFPRSGTQRRRCLEAILAAGDHGRTFDELIVELEMYSAQKRLHDLKLGDWVTATGRTRPTRTGARAEIYIISPKGLAWARQQKAA